VPTIEPATVPAAPPTSPAVPRPATSKPALTPSFWVAWKVLTPISPIW